MIYVDQVVDVFKQLSQKPELQAATPDARLACAMQIVSQTASDVRQAKIDIRMQKR